MLRVIGDIHQHYDVYGLYAKTAPYSIQVGDISSVEYEWLNEYDVTKHRFFSGNHDNMDLISSSPHNLGDYGVHSVPNFGDVFFIRGAWSIDSKQSWKRLFDQLGKNGVIKKKNYWPDKEELSIEELNKAIDLYKEVKPDFVLSHECPYDVLKEVTDPDTVANMGYEGNELIRTRTNLALSSMLEIHKPKVWCFGHYHRHKSFDFLNTKFYCVGLCQCVDFKAYPV